MIPYLLHRNAPPLHGVAFGAVGAHLALVHVCVTVLAVLTDIRKYRLYVTLRAPHLFVHAPQRITGFVVIELWLRLDRPPPTCRVTVLTRLVERKR